MDAQPSHDLFGSHMVASTSNDAAVDSIIDYLLLSEMECYRALLDLTTSTTTIEPISNAATNCVSTAQKVSLNEFLDMKPLHGITQPWITPFENMDNGLLELGVATKTVPQGTVLPELPSFGAGLDASSFGLEPGMQDLLLPQAMELLQQPCPSSLSGSQDASPLSIMDPTFISPSTIPTNDGFLNTSSAIMNPVTSPTTHWFSISSQALANSLPSGLPMFTSFFSQPVPVPVMPTPQIHGLSCITSDPMLSSGSSAESLWTSITMPYHQEFTALCPQVSAHLGPESGPSPGTGTGSQHNVGLYEKMPDSPKRHTMKRKTVDPPSPLSPSEGVKRRRMEPSKTTCVQQRASSHDALTRGDTPFSSGSSSPPLPEEQVSRSRKPESKKVTDSAHYRPRNAFFMFRGFVSRIQTTTTPRSIEGSCSSRSSSTPSISITGPPSLSPLRRSPPPPPGKSPTLAQTKVSVSCGKIWSSECLQSCGKRGCANCRMRSLFSQASDYLKLRQTELERRLEFSEGYGDGTSDSDHPRRSNPLDIQDSCNDDDENNQDRGEITDPSVGGLARMTLEGSLNWKEFQQLYYESDLFKWHREAYLGRDGMLDLEEMKRIWIDNEKSYEKSFLDGARKRILQDGSKNAKKTRQRGMVM